jgi:phosphatidate cytidylyltransferase
MLRWRILTGTILAVAALTVVWSAPTTVVAAVFAAVALFAGDEWAGLAGLDRPARLGYVLALGLALAAVAGLMAMELPLGVLVGAAAVVWLTALGHLVAYARGRQQPWSKPAMLVIGGLLLTASWVSVIAPYSQNQHGAYWLTALFIMVWGSDIGGYFAGRAWGSRALSRRISPSKTWEGCAGGLVLALVGLAALIALVSGLGLFVGKPPWHHLLFVAPVVAAAIAGDLFESVLKRQAGVKDSGRIVAGHGGVLDRVDALLMAAPVYAVLAVGSA